MNTTTYSNLTLIRHDGNLEVAELGGEWMLMNLDTHAITKLNELGGFIWSIVPECPTVELLAERIGQEYGAPSETVLADVERFVDEMVKLGLFAIA